MVPKLILMFQHLAQLASPLPHESFRAGAGIKNE